MAVALKDANSGRVFVGEEGGEMRLVARRLGRGETHERPRGCWHASVLSPGASGS